MSTLVGSLHTACLQLRLTISFRFQRGSLINCPQNFCQKSQKNNKNEAQAMSSLTLSGAVFSLSSVLVGRLVGQVDVLGAVWSLRCTLKGTAWLLSCSTVLLCHSPINTTQIYEKEYEAVSDQGPVWVQSEEKIPSGFESTPNIIFSIPRYSLFTQLSEKV